jgi:hypothetical protein
MAQWEIVTNLDFNQRQTFEMLIVGGFSHPAAREIQKAISLYRRVINPKMDDADPELIRIAAKLALMDAELDG